MKYTEADFIGMDYELIFKKDNKLIYLCTNGCFKDKFLVDEDSQEILLDYFSNKSTSSSYIVNSVVQNLYPVIDDFVEIAKKGLYAYDMYNGNETLVVEPSTPLLVSELSEELQSLLTEF